MKDGHIARRPSEKKKQDSHGASKTTNNDMHVNQYHERHRGKGEEVTTRGRSKKES